MIAQPVTVLLVDDAEGKLGTLKSQLESSESPSFIVHDYVNPYEAMQYLLEHPGVVEFAFIDHFLVSNLPAACPREVPRELSDGIDLARAISKKWPHIGIIVYSGDARITERDKWRGLAAGAHRYVHIKPPENLLEVATKEFISEIRELRELQQTLERFHEMRSRTDVLQRSVRVGIDLIDRRFKVRYRNEEFREITGQSSSPHQFCCACFHNRDWPPCRGCLVAEVLRFSQSQWREEHEQGGISRIFYSPVYPGGQLRYKYMHVWAEPVYALGHTDVPIAVVESVIDLTDSPTIERMGIEQNLDILLQTITELTCSWLEPEQVPISKDGSWEDSQKQDERPGYTRVRVYRADYDGPQPVVKLLGTRGLHHGLPDSFAMPLLRTPEWDEQRQLGENVCRISEAEITQYVDEAAINNMLGCTVPPLVFGLFSDQKEWIGWLAVDTEGSEGGARALDERDADCLRPYAEEAARVLQYKLGQPGLMGSEPSAIIEEVQSRIVLADTPRGALQTVIDGIVGKRGITMGHIRIIRNNKLQLAAGKGFYYDHATHEIRADVPHSLSQRVARTGLPLVVNKRPDPRIEDSIAHMPDVIRAKMEPVRSVGVFPLKGFGQVEAVLALYGEDEDIFTDETVLLCSRLAEIASYTLHDTTLQDETAKATARIWRAAAASFAHRIGNTLPVAQYRLRMIEAFAGATGDIPEDASIALGAVNRAIEIARRFKEHASGIVVNTTRQPLVEVACQIVDYCRSQHPELEIELALDEQALSQTTVDVDLDALKDVFLSFVVDSTCFHPDGPPKVTIQCELEKASGTAGTVVLYYMDDGPGVPDGKKEKIFEPFHTTSDSGCGIGLTDVKAVVQSHGASVRETGKCGSGVRFEITFPL